MATPQRQHQGQPDRSTAVRRGVAYQLQIDIRDGCLEATVQAHSQKSIWKAALTAGAALIVVTWTMHMNYQVAVMVLGLLCCARGWAYSTAVAKETFRVLPCVGVVLTSTSVAGFKLSHFLAWEHAGPVIINEHVTTVAVSSYLAVLDIHTKKLLPVFNTLRPPLVLLQQVYRAVLSVRCERLSGDGLSWDTLTA